MVSLASLTNKTTSSAKSRDSEATESESILYGNSVVSCPWNSVEVLPEMGVDNLCQTLECLEHTAMDLST